MTQPRPSMIETPVPVPHARRAELDAPRVLAMTRVAGIHLRATALAPHGGIGVFS